MRTRIIYNHYSLEKIILVHGVLTHYISTSVGFIHYGDWISILGASVQAWHSVVAIVGGIWILLKLDVVNETFGVSGAEDSSAEFLYDCLGFSAVPHYRLVFGFESCT